MLFLYLLRDHIVHQELQSFLVVGLLSDGSERTYQPINHSINQPVGGEGEGGEGTGWKRVG